MTLTAHFDGDHGYGCGSGMAFCSATVYYWDAQRQMRLWSYCGDGSHGGTCEITTGAIVGSNKPLSEPSTASFTVCDGIDVACAYWNVDFAPYPVNLSLTGIPDGHGSVKALFTNPPLGFPAFSGLELYDLNRGTKVGGPIGFTEDGGVTWPLTGCAGPWFKATFEYGDEIRETGNVHLSGFTRNGVACPDLPPGTPGPGPEPDPDPDPDPEPTGPTLRDYALRFQPVLRFDAFEDLRPLNVDKFLEDGRHKVCRGTAATCTNIHSASDLTSVTDPKAYINVSGKTNALGGNRPQSPNPACIGGTPIKMLDCDTGEDTALYYGAADKTGGSTYDFIDYWAFYRDNFFTLGGLFYHEGDWERITVAPSADATTFDFVAMSQHEAVWAYLKDALRCQSGPSASVPPVGHCEGAGSQHVAVMVSRGSHANYASPCVAILPTCNQNAWVRIAGIKVRRVPENGYSGTREWGAAFNANNLLPLPQSGQGNWTDWQGRWGPAGSTSDKGSNWSDGPKSPGNQDWDIQCAELSNGNGKCPTLPLHNRTTGHGPFGEGPGGGDPTASATRASATDHATEFSRCDRWIGPGVGAVVCDPEELAAAVRNGTVGRPTVDSPTLAAGGKQIAQGAGVAQAVSSAPLKSGTPVKLKGPLGASSRVLVRYRERGTKTVKVASFRLGKLARRYSRTGGVALTFRVGKEAHLGPIREG